MSLYLIGGILLWVLGAAVSLLFWIPGVINRRRLRELLGSRYPMVYLVYSANGPLLLVAGTLLLLRYFDKI